MSDAEGASHRRQLDAGTEEVWAALERAAEGWQGSFERSGDEGRLALPVAAGLRHGVAQVRASVEGTRARAELTLVEAASDYRLHRVGFAMLATSGLGALVTLLCPFFPSLLPFLPVGILLAVSGWFVVVSRVRMSGVADFLDSVAAELDAGLDSSPPGE